MQQCTANLTYSLSAIIAHLHATLQPNSTPALPFHIACINQFYIYYVSGSYCCTSSQRPTLCAPGRFLQENENRFSTTVVKFL